MFSVLFNYLIFNIVYFALKKSFSSSSSILKFLSFKLDKQLGSYVILGLYEQLQ